MKKTKLILPILFVFLFASTSQALVQFRGHYGLSKPSGANSIEPDLGTFGADVIVSLPLFPIVFGLRYEKMNGDDSLGGGLTYESDLTRISGLVGYRLIDTLLYVGALGTLGLVHDGESMVTGQANADIDMDFSASVAVEAGVKLNDFILGGELGYLMGEDSGRSPDFDYGGVYGKIHLGYEF